MPPKTLKLKKVFELTIEGLVSYPQVLSYLSDVGNILYNMAFLCEDGRYEVIGRTLVNAGMTLEQVPPQVFISKNLYKGTYQLVTEMTKEIVVRLKLLSELVDNLDENSGKIFDLCGEISLFTRKLSKAKEKASFESVVLSLSEKFHQLEKEKGSGSEAMFR
jgi:hypothetical protein